MGDGGAAVLTLDEIKHAAYYQIEPANMTHEERSLWIGLGFCYEWYRAHPEDKDKCDKLAQEYIKFFWKGTS